MTSKLHCVNIINSDDICIESISFSNCGQYLAASYGNNIAIYEVRSSFLLTTLSDCNTDASFRSLLWIPLKKAENLKLSDYRLFTVGLHGIITEWDLNLFKSKESCTSYGGAIFSGVVSPKSDLLVTCDDGCVRSFSIWDYQKAKDRLPCLDFKKVQVTHSKSILSLCCLQDGRFFCGTSDSLILICDLEKDNYFNVIKVSSKKMTKRANKDSEKENSSEDELIDLHKHKANKDEHNQLNSEHNDTKNKQKQKHDEKQKEKEKANTQLNKEKERENDNVHIWCLVYIPNNTLASGDSNGNVMLWDLETLTMLQLFTQHNSDVISLVLLNSNTLFSAGLDSKVTMYTNNTASTPHYLNEAELYLKNDLEEIETYLNNKSRVGWSVNGFKYPLKGDIRTLSVSSVQELVASAGNFGCISICRGQRFLNHKKSKYKLMYPNIFPFNPVISMNVHKNMALVRYAYHCDLWYLPTTYNDTNLDMDMDLNLSLNFTKNSNLDKKAHSLKQNDRFESEVPYKLCTMKMNVNKGEIKMCCLSPEGDFVAISNEQCLRILLVHLDDLKISQLKFEYPNLNVTSMTFLSNNQLLLTHFKERNMVSVYNMSDGSLKDLDYLDFDKHVVKITTHPKKLDLGVFYCLDGTVYVVDFTTESYLKLPGFEGGSRISNVCFSNDCKYLIAFSTSFKYYIFNLDEKNILKYQDQFIHNINTKVINANSVICNSFWLSNTVIVHTSYNMFYFKLKEYPFNTLDSDKDLNGVNCDKDNDLNKPSLNNHNHMSNRNNTNSNLNDNNHVNCNGNSSANENGENDCLSTPTQTKNHVNNLDNKLLNQNQDSNKKLNTPRNRKQSITIAPRRLYQIPSIEHHVYDHNENELLNNNHFNHVNCYNKTNGTNGMDNSNYSNGVNNSFDNCNNKTGTDREDKDRYGDTEKSLDKTTVVDCNLSGSNESNNRNSNVSSSTDSSGLFMSSSSLSTDGIECSEEKHDELNELHKHKANKDEHVNQEENENKRNEDESPTRVMKNNDKTSIKYNNILKSKFIVHADLLLKDQQINIMAFKTSLKDEVMRQKRYGN